jgi:hypothetical protein
MKKDQSFWTLFIFLQFISLIVIPFNVYYQAAVGIFIFQFLSLFYSVGEGYPIRYLIGTVYSLNYLLSPVLMFNWLNPYIGENFRMKGEPDFYFTYAIASILLFLAGLHFVQKKNDEKFNIDRIKQVLQQYPRLPVMLVVIGFIADFSSSRFLASPFFMVITAMANLKFAGLFLHILSGKKLNILFFVLVIGRSLMHSLGGSIFNDLINILFFLSFALSIRYKPKTSMKIAVVGGGLVLITVIQIIKMPLREYVMENQDAIQNVNQAVGDGFAENAQKSISQQAADVIYRLDQGWVTSSVFRNYYQFQAFDLQKGKHGLIMLKSSVLPRVLAPDKYEVGGIKGRELFNTYSGHFIAEGTSIALGILSDGFIDFGLWGVLVLFVWGAIFGFFIGIYDKLDAKYPLAKVLSATCFFYAIRPDTDTHSALGSLVKVTFFLWILLIVLDKYYFKPRQHRIPSRHLKLNRY